MAVMENVVRVGKTYKVRKRIPPECRAGFGVSGEFKTVSLHTSDKREAQRLALPILAEIEAQIALIRAGLKPTSVQPVTHGPVDRQTAFRRIEDWRRQTIQAASEAAWSGMLPPLTNDEAVALSTLRSQLRANVAPEGFEGRLADVLGVAPSHPVLTRRELAQAFLSAWKDVEDFTDDFRNDRFDGWPEESEPAPTSVAAPVSPPVFAKPEAGLTPLELYDRWAAVASIQLEDRNRGYIQRLQEFLGPKPISQIEPDDLARFRVATLKFPNTKRPAILARPFNEIVEWGAGEGRETPSLDEATVWKWINTAKQMFAYAAKNRWIEINPAEDTMKKPAKKRRAREPFDANDIAEIFSKPMFTGFSGRVDEGYRKTPGDQVVRDAKFWMPILGLYTGARMEEIGSTLVSEIRQIDGVWAIDIVDRGDEDDDDRSIKNDQSRRIVPIHQRVIDLGFLDYVQKLDRKGYLFPDLVPSQTKRGIRRTVNFSSWWALFCTANANVKGVGMDARKKPFHSFRHTAIRALRKHGANTVLAYMLVGHEEGEVDRINLGYGEGADIRELKQTIDLIDYPTFNLTR
jgi:integrase